MGTTERVVIVAANSAPPTLTLETNWFPGQAPQLHSVLVRAAEFGDFEATFLSRPFGSSTHVVSIESISSTGSGFKCTIRVSSDGRRQTQGLEISEETFVALQAVLDSNIISEGYVRA